MRQCGGNSNVTPMKTGLILNCETVVLLKRSMHVHIMPCWDITERVSRAWTMADEDLVDMEVFKLKKMVEHF